MAKELKIFLFRHGQSEFNRDKKFTGWLDPKLTPFGIEQAQKIANLLRDKEFQVAYCTRLSRSQETLMEVLKFHPGVEIIEDDRIIERSYGDLQGRTHQSVIDEVGKQQFDIAFSANFGHRWNVVGFPSWGNHHRYIHGMKSWRVWQTICPNNLSTAI